MLVLPAKNADSFSFQGLGYLPSHETHSEANAVSADGRVVVGLTSVGRRGYQAFRWEAATGMVGLGTLDPSLRFPYSEAHAVSPDGSIVVGMSFASAVPGEMGRAFRWDAQSGIAAISGELPGLSDSVAEGVSADGSVIVGSVLFKGRPARSAFRWEESTGMVLFDSVPGGVPDASDAPSISADGRVIVGGGSRGAFRWDADRGSIDLQPAGFVLGGMAQAVSADGRVVVGNTGQAGSRFAFRWDAQHGLQCFERGRDIALSEARAVSGDGSTVVGIGYHSPESSSAVVWDAIHGVRRVDEVLRQLGVDTTGWTLTTANGTSFDGTTIVGNGIDPDGNPSSWIAVIPEPTSALLIGLGLAGLAAIGARPGVGSIVLGGPADRISVAVADRTREPRFPLRRRNP